MLLSLGNILSNLYNFCGREDCWCHNCRYVFPDLLDQPQEFAHWGKISSLLRSGGMTQFHTAVACMQKSTWKSDYSVVGRIWGQRSESKSLWWRSHSPLQCQCDWCCSCNVTILRRKYHISFRSRAGCQAQVIDSSPHNLKVGLGLMQKRSSPNQQKFYLFPFPHMHSPLL